jgi:polyribonucleotide nucleotidyltransferase
LERQHAVTAIKDEVKAAIIEKLGEAEVCDMSLNMAFEELEAKLYRNNNRDHNRRVDGRASVELRLIEYEMNVLPIVHGSSLFQRGETQSLVSLTLGYSDDSQEIDAIRGDVE